MIGKLKKILTGLSIPQEYVCTPLENFSKPLSVTLSYKGADAEDVTKKHLFLGYKPVIIGLIVDQANFDREYESEICLCFHNESFIANSIWNGFKVDNRSLAKLSLKKLAEEWKLGDKRVVFYEGERGEHKFLNFFNAFINHQREKLKRPVTGNVDLPGNLSDQVQIAYSVPRIISVISLGDDERINLFPTDLHGPVGEDFYISSLRKGGKANEQVERFDRIVISEVNASAYKDVYALGKNHMQNLSARSGFNILKERSESFHFPLPYETLRYRELKRIKSFDCGIHRIHAYEVISSHFCESHHSTLSQIHQHYAQWREDHGISTQMLLR